ncbi:MAG TPA: phage holin family protein [Thermoanaerobaculia bacterium]|nr:phage holin family protein [Thermoanaerobaculia bacterium]
MGNAEGFPPEFERERKTGIFARLRDAWEATQRLVSTRAEIFQEEVSEKGSLLARAALAIGIALVLGWLALLLFTALAAVALVNLLGSLWAGLLAALGIYLVAASVAAFLGWKSFSRIRPFAFPATQDGLREDWTAIRDSLRTPPRGPEEESDLEDRFRAGSE